MTKGKRGAPLGNQNAKGRGVGRAAGAAATGSLIGAAATVGKVGVMSLKPVATLALGVPIVKTAGLTAMGPGAAIGAGAGLAGYAGYKAYKRFRKK